MNCPEFNEFELHSGAFAVREMSPKAQIGAAADPDLRVYEYQASDRSRVLPTSCRYAIVCRDQWQDGLLKQEVEFILERIANESYKHEKEADHE